jgi:hypothetical protein
MKTPIAAVLAILTVAGCAGQPAPSPNTGAATSTSSAAASPEPLFVMITETGCTASPASMGEVNAGRNVWSVLNRLAGPASFQLMRIEGSYHDAADWFEDAAMSQAPGDEPPFIAEELSRVLVAPGATELLTDELGPGVHAIVCFVLDEHEDIVTAYLAGPFTVADAA